MAKKYRVLIPQDIPESGKELLRRIDCEPVMGTGASEETIKREIRGCRALVARTAPITRAILEAADELAVISRFGVGVENIDIAAATERGVWVANTPQANSISVAEHAIAMLLACATNLVAADAQTKRGNFAFRNQTMGIELYGRTLGIAGLGRIGRHMARIAGPGLGMRVLAHDPYLARENAPEGVIMTDSLETLLADSDAVSLNFPATPETKASFGRRQFALMKPGALFINCSRGEVVVETDLAEALRAKRIAWAALDVFEPEPPAADNPLFSLPNVVATPHTASFTRGAFDRMAEHMVHNIANVLSGGKPAWPVNNPAVDAAPTR